VKKKLILIGGGGHCKSCIDVIEQTDQFKLVGILDKQEFVGQQVLSYDIIGTDEQIARLVIEGYQFLITIGQLRSSKIRQRLFAQLQECNAMLATVISPRAYVSTHALVEEGTIVMHDALINSNARIGKNCIINSKALIEHDVVIGDHCHISTSATINGGVEVKKGSFFGSNAVSKEYVTTSNDDFIKAGSLFLGKNNA
jgi:sugar O-acyltransferase (sialic acid O-acetyltransferase NeuD family)